MARIDERLSDAREIDVRFAIHALDLRDDIGHDDSDHGDGDEHDRERIDERSLYLPRQISFSLFFHGDDLKRLTDLTGGISHLQDGHVEHAKNTRKFRGDAIKRLSGFD